MTLEETQKALKGLEDLGSETTWHEPQDMCAFYAALFLGQIAVTLGRMEYAAGRQNGAAGESLSLIARELQLVRGRM